MSKDLKLNIAFAGKDNLSSVLKSVSTRAGALRDQLSETATAKRKLEKTKGLIDNFKKTTASISENTLKLSENEKELVKLNNKIKKSIDPTKGLNQLYKKAQQQTDKLTQSKQKLTARLESESNSLKKTRDSITATNLKLSEHQRQLINVSNAIKKSEKPNKALEQQYTKLKKQTAQLEQGKKRLVSTLEKESNQFKKTTGSIVKHNIKISQSQRELIRLSSAIKRTAAPSKQLNDLYKKAQTQSAKLSKEKDKLNNRLNKESDALNQAGLSSKRLTQHEAKLNAALKKTNTTLRQRTKSLALSNKLQKSQAKLGNLHSKSGGRALKQGAIAGSAMYAGASFAQEGINFEKQMSAVGALSRVDKDSDEFKQVKALALKLGSETSFTAGEAAQGMQYLAMAGFKSNEILQTMPNLLNLSKAGNTDLATTADIASNILSGFRLEADQMGRVGDVLTATFTRSNVSLSMLGESMKYVAPIASELGASVEEASAIAGLLGNVGIQGSQAGTAMRALYNRMAKPPKAGEKALIALGIATKDAQGNLLAMPDILASVAKATENMGNADRVGYFKDIAGAEAGAAMAALVERAGAGAIIQFSDILKDAQGEAKRVAQEMEDNLDGDLTKLSSIFSGLKIGIFDQNSGALREITQNVTKLMSKISKFATDNEKLVSSILAVTGVVVGLIAGFAMFNFAIFSLTGPLKILLSVVPKISFVISALSKAMLLNPIGLMITAVIALIAGMVLLYQNCEPVKRFLDGMWSGFLEGIKPLMEILAPLKRIFFSIVDAISYLFDGLGLLFPSLASTTGSLEGISSAGQTMGKVIAGAIDFITTPARLMIELIDSILTKLKMLTEINIGDKLSELSDNAIKYITPDWLSNDIDIKGKLSSASDSAIKFITPDWLSRKNDSSMQVAKVSSSKLASNMESKNRKVEVIKHQPLIKNTTKQQINTSPINIKINAAPGMDEQAIARAVTAQLKQREREQARRNRSQFSDFEGA